MIVRISKRAAGAMLALTAMLLSAVSARATTIVSTGDPDGLIASASRTGSGTFEIETGDDFILSSTTSITSATFTGLITGTAPSINSVKIEIYRVFPNDSDTLSTPSVPTRVNSPADVALDSRSSAGSSLNFTATTLGTSFTASNSLQAGGINPLPGQTTGGNGPITGMEVQFSVTFTAPFSLLADHYFFVPQVDVADGEFLWLSAPKPIVASGTPFAPDLQAWARDENLDPDWLRIGTDIVGGSPAPTYNFVFSLDGRIATPLPAALPLFATGLGVMGLLGWRRKRKAQTLAA